MTSKHILLTGCAGFIGSNIADNLIKLGHKVRGLDNLSTGYTKNIEHLFSHPNFEFVQGDISNIETVRTCCKDIDIICNQAALGSVPRSIIDPITSHVSNVNGFLNVLVVAKEMGIKRIVYASSSSVYGDSVNLPKVEDITGSVLSPYAVTKCVNELYAGVFSKLYELECIGLRYFNVYGPKQDPFGVYAAVIPKFISSIRDGVQPTINGDGSYSRDFTYIDNVVNANCQAMFTENSDCYGQVFNIGAKSRITILEMYDSIAKNMNSDMRPIFGPIRKGDIEHSNANIDKAVELLGYDPKVQFDEGIVKTIDFFMGI